MPLPLPMPKALPLPLLLPFPIVKPTPFLPILTKIAKGVTIDFPKPPLTFPMPKALPLRRFTNERQNQFRQLRTAVRRMRHLFPA